MVDMPTRFLIEKVAVISRWGRVLAAMPQADPYSATVGEIRLACEQIIAEIDEWKTPEGDG